MKSGWRNGLSSYYSEVVCLSLDRPLSSLTEFDAYFNRIRACVSPRKKKRLVDRRKPVYI